MYNFLNLNLADFPRAVQVAQAYQHYRIKQVKLTLKFPYDTFADAAGNNSKPNLYYMIDKSGSIPLNPTLELLKTLGARPHACDNKPFTITWRPSVLNEVLTGPAGTFNPAGTQYKISPWLSTVANPRVAGPFVPSNVSHLGLYFYLEQLFLGPAGGTQFNLEVEVQFQFKKPNWKISPGVPESKPIQMAIEDNSSDGIVGGPDTQQPAQT